MTRDLNHSEKFISERLATLSAANPDPFMYDIATGHFMQELARAVGLVLGESAPPGRKMRFFNELYMVLAAIEAGMPQKVRLSPPAPPVPNLPPPEEHQAWVGQFLAPDGELATDNTLLPSEMKAARVAQRLRQRDVGEYVGVGNWVISDWEYGKEVPTREQLVALREVLKLPPTGFPPELMTTSSGHPRQLPARVHRPANT